jgi:Uncharacterized conserved protein
MIKVKRVYDKADITDGDRILVDRLWPRGIRRSTPNIDVWIKDVAPSDELRKWFAHDPAKWKAFKEKYRKELASNKALDKLIEYINSKDSDIPLFHKGYRAQQRTGASGSGQREAQERR